MSKNKEVAMDELKNFHITAEWPALENIVKLYMRMAVYEKLNEIRAEIEAHLIDENDNMEYLAADVGTRGAIEVIDKHLKKFERYKI